MQLEDLYRSGKLSKTELEEMGIAERRFQAAQILDPAEVSDDDGLVGLTMPRLDDL